MIEKSFGCRWNNSCVFDFYYIVFAINKGDEWLGGA